MRSRGVNGMCRPQCGQVQKERRQSLYRSVSLYSGAEASGPVPHQLGAKTETARGAWSFRPPTGRAGDFTRQVGTLTVRQL